MDSLGTGDPLDLLGQEFLGTFALTPETFAGTPNVAASASFTISGALLMGIDRVTATRMSFFLGIPTLVAAGGLQAVTQASAITAGVGWGATVIGLIVSFVVAYASIAWLLKFVATNDFTAFIIYRIVVGLVIGGLLLGNVITPV